MRRSSSSSISSLATPLLKLCFWIWIVGTLIHGWTTTEYAYWFLAYLTQWTLLLSCIYMTCSFLVSTMTVPRTDIQETHPRQWALIKIVWILYTIASAAGATVAVLYWVFIYDYGRGTPPSYYTIMSHGIAFLVVLLDGMIVNSIPLRLKHFVFTLCYGVLFITWSIIQAFAYIDNPEKTSSDEDPSEALYSILDWINTPKTAAIISVIANFFALPLFSILFWFISMSCCRKYVDEKEGEDSASDAIDSTRSTGKNNTTHNAENGSDTHVDDDLEVGGIEAQTY